ncbi:hypothetical protein QA640_45375 (plasmid) [Bradyrhizobium sp. CB82]|uniref:hypothetical protein n=1 Tax=Bradyrhizobium sp. CB82 TaxID=3039159 RepID=UPI0024B1E5E7|nr:hypothetical protein [Bradyrhizobium sp. CB82]WFU46010.1 hypothetical protein QA640_45375 [Bradyrhizobium sp. CB82]
MVTIDTLPRDTGLTAEQIKLKLQYLKNHDEIEIFRGQVKLKPGKAAKKKVHWKTAQKMAREAAEAAKNGKTVKGALLAAGSVRPARAARAVLGDAAHGRTEGKARSRKLMSTRAQASADWLAKQNSGAKMKRKANGHAKMRRKVEIMGRKAAAYRKISNTTSVLPTSAMCGSVSVFARAGWN